jgi:hypothetical protein
VRGALPQDPAAGGVVKPDVVNGVKLELFIFDAFPFAKKFLALEIDRVMECLPLRSPSGRCVPSCHYVGLVPNRVPHTRLLQLFASARWTPIKWDHVACLSQDSEFAPVKNASGSASDSPDTAREMVSACHKAWVLEAGGSFGSVLAHRAHPRTTRLSVCHAASARQPAYADPARWFRRYHSPSPPPLPRWLDHVAACSWTGCLRSRRRQPTMARALRRLARCGTAPRADFCYRVSSRQAANNMYRVGWYEPWQPDSRKW